MILEISFPIMVNFPFPTLLCYEGLVNQNWIVFVQPASITENNCHQSRKFVLIISYRFGLFSA